MRVRWVPAIVVLAWVAFGGPLALSAGKLSTVQRDDPTSLLPTGAESTAVFNLDAAFQGRGTTPALLAYVRPNHPAAAFAGVGVLLPMITGLLILLILLVAYRSPVVPVLVLLAAGFALAVANGVVLGLAQHGVVAVSGLSRGILDVLVLGAGSGYALLIVSRLREEL